MKQDSENRIYGFEPVCDADARILILGSMPSVQSLKQAFYYAHPRNAFWKIISEIAGEDVPVSIDEKKQLLAKNRIALWDTVGSCIRQGSLDSNIHDAVANDFDDFFKRCPLIGGVFFNGGTAASLYKRMVGLREDLRYHYLPSTSPAYTMPYKEKLKLWMEAWNYESLRYYSKEEVRR